MLYRAYFFVWLAALLCQELMLLISGYPPLEYALPLHLCSYSACIGIISLISKRVRRKPWVRRFLLMLGSAGAIAAMLFPALLPAKYPALSALTFYLMHLLLLLCPFVLARERAEAEAHTRLKAIALTVPLIAAAYLADVLFSANYLFLSLPPEQLSFLTAVPMPLRPVIVFCTFSLPLLMIPVPKRMRGG